MLSIVSCQFYIIERIFLIFCAKIWHNVNENLHEMHNMSNDNSPTVSATSLRVDEAN